MEQLDGAVAVVTGGGNGIGRAMDPEAVGQLAVDGVRRGDFVIMTHVPGRELVEQRSQDIRAAFDALDAG
jgi:NAD(P)-dependent dehydrogenase (short-subunit alcohol dehydrogenase family)